ncbi:soluble quino protein glucose dehydrogenase [Exidia glandulosa HHB12029]|uniref:Soluble quino protein glucose dehydrogenase n=1 Tax=Exidia glandulosa HHB12029 TaxID=1314781 RepID=A0A165GW92_EXIGL|nr:soluble quino protein glucose dehydrogenase [Exidia glandulosa HHB12029]
MKAALAVVFSALCLNGSVLAAWVTPKFKLNTASGWTAHGVANGLATPRSLVFDSAGHLLVLEKGTGIVAFTLNSDGSVASKTTVLSYSYPNHGLALSVDGKTLFASSSNTAWKWDYNATSLKVSNQKKVVTGMDNDDHVTRTLLVSSAHPSLLIVSRGSNNNLDMGATASSGRAQVKVFDWTKLPSGDVGYDFTSQGKILGYGVRNEVGLVEDGAGRVWGVENSADNLVRVRSGVSYDVHQDNPGEKLHLFGDAQSVSSGPNYGYPNCFSVWNPSSGFPSSDSFKTGDWFVQQPNSSAIDTAWCNSNTVKPKLLFQAHSAPLDIKLGPKSDPRAYVAFHGSWNRSPPTGYKVVAVPGAISSSAWNPTASITSTTGYVDILTNSNVTSCPGSCFRPAGLVFNSDGTRLYVASDATGEVFMLQRS